MVDGKRLDVADTAVGDEALQVTRQLVNIKDISSGVCSSNLWWKIP